MVLPAGWPPRPASGRRSIRFYKSGTATADFADSAYLFSDVANANTFAPTPYVKPGSTAPVAVGDLTKGGSPMGGGVDVHDVDPTTSDTTKQPAPHNMIWAFGIKVINDGPGDLEISFDGTNVHGVVLAVEKYTLYWHRHEAGIAVRGAGGAAFRIEAW